MAKCQHQKNIDLKKYKMIKWSFLGCYVADKLHINDPDMKLAAKAAERYETTSSIS
jgi:hypothetical protein